MSKTSVLTTALSNGGGGPGGRAELRPPGRGQGAHGTSGAGVARGRTTVGAGGAEAVATGAGVGVGGGATGPSRVSSHANAAAFAAGSALRSASAWAAPG